MKKVLITALTVASLATTSMAFAGQQPAKHDGFYVGGGLGWGSLYNASNEDSANVNLQLTSSLAARADMGYLFSVSSSWLAGLEAGFIYFPVETKRKLGAEFSAESVDLLAVAKYLVTPKVSLFGKVGMAYVHAVSTSIEDKNDSDKVNKFMPELAVGAGYSITPALEATVTYAHAFGYNENNPGFNTVLAGLDYHFSM